MALAGTRVCKLDGCENKLPKKGRSDRLYCCREHVKRAGKKRTAARWLARQPPKEPVILDDKACQECGDMFTPNHATRLYCFTCAPTGGQRKDPIHKVCVMCDAPYTATGTGAHYRKYCEDCQKIMVVKNKETSARGVATMVARAQRIAESNPSITQGDALALTSAKVYEGDCKKCGTHWLDAGAGAGRRKFCLDCHPPKPFHELAASRDMPYCQLEGCNKQIKKKNGRPAKYCCAAHRTKAAKLRTAAKSEMAKAAETTRSMFRNPNSTTAVPQERQGHVFDLLKSDSLTAQMLLDGEITASAVAVKLGVTTPAVTRAMHALLSERAVESERAKWQQSSRVRAMLPKATMDRARELGLSGRADTQEFAALVDELVRAYSVFSRRHFNLEGKRPLIKGFHLLWIRSIIVAYATGGKQLILSPPRVGKSETLIRFVIWVIAMDPNIRVGWFCASRDVAELMLGSVKDILESDENLIRAVLPPGELFDPGLKSNKPWSKKEIKVAQQTHIGAKSSTLLALGRTSKFLSRDMDIIIIDDLEDFDSTREEGQRLYSKNKLAEIGTRKVEETAEIYIGSRQHPDDIPNSILDLEDTILQWKIIVNTAHDEECTIEPDDPANFHLHVDCMLFPEVRSYRYLMEKKLEMETLGLAHMYPLRYLNTAVPADGQVFNMAEIRDNALDRERGLGLGELPIGRLMAGLDPSARGIQASFLWHYTKEKMSMVDLDAEQSGGQDGAIKIMRRWFHEYDLRLWFYETNSQQIDFYDRIKKEVHFGMCDICEEPHPEIDIKDHNTGSNKKDPELGISSMAPRYHDGRISLPFGTHDARRKVNMLLRQLELWTTDGISSRNKKHAKTDIKMSSWFPFPYIVRLEKSEHKLTLESSSDSSYPDLSSMGQAPWSQTFYPSQESR